MTNINLASEREGHTTANRIGSTMVLEKYNAADDIWVRFIDSNTLVHSCWADFIKGKVRNVYDRTVYGVGYLGEGEYKTNITDEYGNHKHSPYYKVWNGMMKRCYNTKYIKKFPTYDTCTVCEEWHNFQTFAKWLDENYYDIEGEKIELDKDILFKGNKIYSPETCILVPQKINYLFIKCDARRGELPIGVYQHTQTRKYVANCSNGTKRINLGSYNTPERAFIAYKIYKENLIKQIAEEYKNKIPEKLYNAMMKYEVDIND